MTRYLIINADDFGMDEAATVGIAKAHQHGVVTAASLLANLPNFSQAVRIGQSLPSLDLGVHLNLVRGKPVCDPQAIASLVDNQGYFLASPMRIVGKLWRRQLRLSEVEREWDTQVRKVLDTGIQPSHLDSEKHMHSIPKLFNVAVKLALRYGIPYVRVPHDYWLGSNVGSTQGVKAIAARILVRTAKPTLRAQALSTAIGFSGIALTQSLTERAILRLVQCLPEGSITELMVHPGDSAYESRIQTKSTTMFIYRLRHRQLRVLTNQSLTDRLTDLNVQLINFKVASTMDQTLQPRKKLHDQT